MDEPMPGDGPYAETAGPPPAEPTLAEREELLLGGPLGRELLTGFVDPAVDHTLFAALGLGDVPGSAMFAYDSEGGPVRRVRHRKRRNWDQVHAGEVRAAMRTLVADEDSAWRRLDGTGEAEALEELAGVSLTFGFGGGDEAMWGLSAVAAEELRPVAAALARSPGTARWWEPVRRTDQRQLVWGGGDVGLSGIGDAVRREMEQERKANRRGLRHRPRKGERNLGATWWSAPDFAQNTWTTGGQDGLPARDALPTVELLQFIDTFTPFDEAKATVGSLRIDARARVAEIRRPEDWQALVERFPRDVTGTHDGEWRTWADRDGPWYLPDWEALAGHYDGVHVTVGGFVASCGLARPVRDGWTVLAGWVPDATVWVRDVATGTRRLGEWRGEPQDVADREDVLAGWHPVPPR